MVTLTAPAKVTLSLRVTGVRADGYHLIDADMVTVDLYDTVEVEPTTDESSLDVVNADQQVPPGSDNLVLRALTLSTTSAVVRLHKRIPAGAGLGGGSADAAAVLRWAGCTDPDLTVTIGADVPFCVAGGRARVRGIGEIIEPAAHEPLTLTLATPPFGCSTPAVYRAWDELGGPVADGPNDLEPAALAAYPDLARWRSDLGDTTGQTPVLAGSGSTWFVYGNHPGPDRMVVNAVASGWEAPGAGDH